MRMSSRVRSSLLNEYEEQQAIERIALSRHPEATGVKEIQPFLMTHEKDDAWLVILTAPRASSDWSSALTSSREAAQGTSNTKIAQRWQVDYETVRRWRDRWHAAESRLQVIEAAGKPKLLSQAIEVLLSDEQRPGAPAT